MIDIRKQFQRALPFLDKALPVEKQQLTTTGRIFLILLAFLSLSASAHAENYIGKKITEIEKHTAVQWLSKDELVDLISGKILVGESTKTQFFHLYYKKFMAADGSFTLKIFSKSSDTLLKKIPGNTWLVQPDGTWCTTLEDVRRCNKKVCKIGDIYLTVLKEDGTVKGEWSVEEPSTSEK